MTPFLNIYIILFMDLILTTNKENIVETQKDILEELDDIIELDTETLEEFLKRSNEEDEEVVS